MPTTLRWLSRVRVAARAFFARCCAFFSHDRCERVVLHRSGGLRRRAPRRLCHVQELSCIALSLRPACVCGTLLHLWAVVARDECWMHVAISGVSSPYRCVGMQNSHVSLDADAYNVTLTAILLQFLRYRARSRPPRRRASHSKSTPSPRNHASYESSPGGASRSAEFRQRDGSKTGLEGLASVWPCHWQAAADP